MAIFAGIGSRPAIDRTPDGTAISSRRRVPSRIDASASASVSKIRMSAESPPSASAGYPRSWPLVNTRGSVLEVPAAQSGPGKVGGRLGQHGGQLRPQFGAKLVQVLAGREYLVSVHDLVGHSQMRGQAGHIPGRPGDAYAAAPGQLRAERVEQITLRIPECRQDRPGGIRGRDEVAAQVLRQSSDELSYELQPLSGDLPAQVSLVPGKKVLQRDVGRDAVLSARRAQTRTTAESRPSSPGSPQGGSRWQRAPRGRRD